MAIPFSATPDVADNFVAFDDCETFIAVFNILEHSETPIFLSIYQVLFCDMDGSDLDELEILRFWRKPEWRKYVQVFLEGDYDFVEKKHPLQDSGNTFCLCKLDKLMKSYQK
jgi:hypothetical protein